MLISKDNRMLATVSQYRRSAIIDKQLHARIIVFTQVAVDITQVVDDHIRREFYFFFNSIKCAIRCVVINNRK